MSPFGNITIPIGVILLFIPVVILVSRILFPTILSFPWKMPPENSRQRKREKEFTVVLAGSFNPPHWGHLVMIRYLAERYGRVICCIGVNPNKKYDVTPQTRAHLLKEMLASNETNNNDFDKKAIAGTCNNVQVEVVTGYIWRYAREHGASIFFRGIRTWEADGAEERNLQILNTWGPLLLGRIWPINTLFLEGDPRFRNVSSTMIRKICTDGGSNCYGKPSEVDDKAVDELSKFVPRCVANKVAMAYRKN